MLSPYKDLPNVIIPDMTAIQGPLHEPTKRKNATKSHSSSSILGDDVADSDHDNKMEKEYNYSNMKSIEEKLPLDVEIGARDTVEGGFGLLSGDTTYSHATDSTRSRPQSFLSSLSIGFFHLFRLNVASRVGVFTSRVSVFGYGAVVTRIILTICCIIFIDTGYALLMT
jgi:hypothetical protein